MFRRKTDQQCYPKEKMFGQLQVVIFCSHPSCLDGHSCDTAAPCIYPLTHTFISNDSKNTLSHQSGHWRSCDFSSVVDSISVLSCMLHLSRKRFSYNKYHPARHNVPTDTIVAYLYGITNLFLIVFEVCAIGQTLNSIF